MRCPALEPDRLVHVDHDVVVVCKPAGLLTVPWQDETDTLIERTRQALLAGDRDARTSLFVVQRLDHQTSGLLVFARTRNARKRLEAQFRAHSIVRRYIALVVGAARANTIESFLVPDRGDGKRGSWRGAGKPPRAAKWACTHVRVEERFEAATSIACHIETGRQHQIRIHLAEAGTPLLGERIYGNGRVGKLVAERPMLHAATLGFRHPAHNRLLQFEAAPPSDFQTLSALLREGAPS
jgi:23S rRNA pseudouridine1911/1915/1917 synthase